MATSSIYGVSITITENTSSLVSYKVNSSSPLLLSSNSAYSFPVLASRPPSWLTKVNQLLRVSSDQGVSSELEEDSKFVPLNAEDPSYGPPALLLLGFRLEETEKIQQLLKDLDGEFLQVIYCTEDMITRSLWDAVNTKQESLGKWKVAKSVPRICFLSGLSGEEMMMFIDAFEEAGLEPAVFAAHVPNSSSKSLQELIEEVMGDHEMLAGKDSEYE